jgi:signal peptidase I
MDMNRTVLGNKNKPGERKIYRRAWCFSRTSATLIFWCEAALMLVILVASVLPDLMGDRSLVITSGSMEPAIATGSVVIAQPIPSPELVLGDVIAFTESPTAAVPTVHRIVSIDERSGTRFFTTRGDANEIADGEVSLPPQVWRVRYEIPIVGYIIALVGAPQRIILFMVLPLMGLFVLAVRDRLARNRLKLTAY